MKALLVIILSIVGLASAQNYSSYCKDTAGIYAVPSPGDCEHFILCTGPVGSLLECLDGKWFDANYLVCRPKEVAECDGPVVSVPDWVLQLCSTLEVGQTVPAESCSNYYICYGTKAYQLRCPGDQHYSRAYSACMNPVDAGCKALNMMCIGEAPGFTFSAQVCENYYTCNSSYIPELTACGGGLYYNANTGNCTDPASSGCNNPVTIPTTTPTTTKSTASTSTSTTTKSTPTATPTPTPSPTPTPTPTPAGPPTPTPTPTPSAPCPSETTPESPTTTPPCPLISTPPTIKSGQSAIAPVAAPICNSANTGTFFQHAQCNRFYMCFNSAALEFKCDDEQYYDAALAYCVDDKDGTLCPGA